MSGSVVLGEEDEDDGLCDAVIAVCTALLAALTIENTSRPLSTITTTETMMPAMAMPLLLPPFLLICTMPMMLRIRPTIGTRNAHTKPAITRPFHLSLFCGAP